MTPRRRDILLGAAGVAGLAAGGAWWMDRKNSLKVPESLLVAGSNRMHPLNLALAERYAKDHPKVAMVVQAGGSLAGLLALKRGTIDIAAMSRDLTEEEDTPNARAHLVAINEISIVVHPSSPVKSVDSAQLKAIFSGQISNWRALGGPNAPIDVVSRLDGAASLHFIEDEVLDGEEVAVTARTLAKAEEVGEAIAADRNAIGFLAMSEQVKAPVRRLAIDGVLPDRATILSGRYPLTQPEYLVLYGKPSKAAVDFVEFALSPPGQAIVKRMGLTPVG